MKWSNTQLKKIILVPSLMLAAQSVFAQSTDSQNAKSQYNLFNPTPADKMRELSTDRPDRTESPYTVDAGHFQVEMDLVSFTQDKTESSGVEAKGQGTGVLVSNLKMGLTNSMDLQLVLTPWQQEVVEVTGADKETKSGFGDTVLRLKYNFFGNDGGPIAMGIMPFVKFPTAADDMDNDTTEYGVILPVGLELPSEWGMGIMGQVNRMKNEDNDEMHTEFISSVTASHDIVGNLGGYVEFYSESSDEEGASWVATGDLGLTYKVTPNCQFDIGANLGLTHAADDLTTFVGFSTRM